MSRASEFSLEDMDALNKIPNLLRSLEECLDQIRPSLQKHFGEISPRSLKKHKTPCKEDKSSFYEQLYISSRYTLFKHHILEDKSQWSSLYVSIELGANSHDKPRAVLNVWVDECHPLYENIIKDFQDNKYLLGDISLMEDDDEGFDATYSKSLSDFLSESNQFLAIKHWFEERIIILYKYMTQHAKIKWDVNK